MENKEALKASVTDQERGVKRGLWRVKIDSNSAKEGLKEVKQWPKHVNYKKKDKEPIDMESLQHIIRNLSNEIIDLKKNFGESSTVRKPFKSWNSQ